MLRSRKDRMFIRGLVLWLALSLLLTHTSAAQDPWQVLGVRRSATKSEITQAFRRLSRQWHPDKNRSPEATTKFQEISAAYDLLTDPTKAKTLWEASDDETPGSRFTATFGTVQYVLDLDPNRLRELLTTWSKEWAGKNWKTFGPLWTGPVDQTVCWCLENAWRLPQLTEPVSKLLATFKGTKHTEGAWRAWRLSGALLELSAWTSRQPPCLQHHQASSSSADSEATLNKLQQQLQIRRKARQAAVDVARRREQKRKGGSSATNASTAAPGEGLEAGLSAAAEQGSAMAWCVLLAGVAGAFLMGRDRLFVAAGLGSAGVVVYAISTGLLLPDEAAIQQLSRVLEVGGSPANLVGLVFISFSMVVGLLLPLLLAACAFMAVTWLWAASTTLGVTIMPVLSQLGFGVWILTQVYALTGGGDTIKTSLVLLLAAYGLWKVPKAFKWWGSLLFGPVIFLLAFAREILRAAGLWSAAHPGVTKSQQAQPTQQASSQAAPQHAAAPAASAHRGQPEQDRTQQQQQQPSHPAGSQQQQGSPQAAAGVASAAANKGDSSSSRKSKKKVAKVLREGAWWPKSFQPADLAVTAHWYSTLLGWHLGKWALAVAAISCKLTVTVVLLAVASAAVGTPIKALTLRSVVQFLLLRAGMAGGLLWKSWHLLQQ